MKKMLIYLCFILLIFVIDIKSGVLAREIENSDGYARCVYSGRVMDGSINYVASNIAVVIRVYKDTTGGDIQAYAKMRCSDTYNEMATAAIEMNECKITNYNSIFWNADTEIYPYFGEGGWKCPDQIWVNVVPQYPNNGGNLLIKEQDGFTALTLNEEYSVTESKAGVFDSSDDDTGDFMRIPSLSESLNDSLEEEDDHSSVDCSKEENKDTIICSIYAWGMDLTGGAKYSSDAADPCALIDGDIQKLLHKIFFGISIAGIIILVVMTAVSLAKVITASEDEALRNFFKGLWKRLICLIILLLLPMIVTFIIQLVNNVAPSLGIKSDNPLCNVTE